MFRKEIMLMAIALVLLACEVQADVVYSNWVGVEFGYWAQASNWDPPIVPDNNASQTFVVTIDPNNIGLDEVFVVFQQSRSIDQLDCYGVVDLDVWTLEHVWLHVPNGMTNYGQLEPDDLRIEGDFTNISGARCLLDEITIEGDLINQNNAKVEVEVELEVDGYVTNAGTITIIPRSILDVDGPIQNTGSIELIHSECKAGEVLDNNSTGVIQGSGVVLANELLRNKGEISAYGGSLVVLSEGPLLNSGLLSNYPLSSLQIRPTEDVNNYGTIEVHAGGGIAFDCNVVNEPNATIQLLGGTFAAASITQSAKANFAGFGGITGDVLIDPNGIIRLIGSTNVVGNMEIADGATLQISDGTTLITGHTMCNNGTIHMIGGRVICQGGLTNNNCNIIWEPGTYTNMADFNLDGKVNFKDFAYFGDTWLWQADWY